MNLISDAKDVGLANLHVILDLWRAGKSESLIDYTRSMRVEPVVMVDSSLLFDEATPEVMQSLLSNFAGYYLQAAALSCTVGKISTMRHLDKLNPNRSPIDSAGDTAVAATNWMTSLESYQFRLPRHTDQYTSQQKMNWDVMPVRGDQDNSCVALESRDGVYQVALEAAKPKKDEGDKSTPPEKRSEFGFTKDTIQTVKELSNLSVGKMLSVEISDGIHKASIPVAIRLMAASLPSQTLAHMLSLGKQDTSMSARWHGWRSGRLAFWRDLIGCQDLIDAHRDALMQDKDGLFRQIVARKRKNTFAGILSGNPSVATASNMAVLSKETADMIELETVGSLDNFNTRQKLFEPTSLMILAVVSKEYSRVTFYFRGIAEKTELSLRDIKAANKGSGPDVGDILKAFTSGHAPSL
ncbi:MAG: hypothetical protein P4L77_10840 [Sulfuriferula sp.]|nr:hypothetical protein [Sulfuriferula sp.]